MVKIWVDDVRKKPDDYDIWLKSVTDTIHYLRSFKPSDNFLIDIDHDAGDFSILGGDYYKILDWCEKHHLNPTVHIHSMNPVGIQKMRLIIQRNNWKEI